LEIPLFPVVIIVLKPVKLNKLPIEEIRERLLRGDQPITGHVLNKLERDPRKGARKIYKLLKQRHDKERIDRARIFNMLNFGSQTLSNQRKDVKD
jgi:hypothetical protein